MYLAKQTNNLIISSCEKMVTQGKNIHSLKLKWQSLNIEIFFSWSSFDKILLTFNKIIHNRPNQKTTPIKRMTTRSPQTGLRNHCEFGEYQYL